MFPGAHALLALRCNMIQHKVAVKVGRIHPRPIAARRSERRPVANWLSRTASYSRSLQRDIIRTMPVKYETYDAEAIHARAKRPPFEAVINGASQK